MTAKTDSNPKFYTYVHRKADTGEVFYVGKGMGYRHQDKNNRNKHWNNVVSKHGLVVEMVAVFFDEEAAFHHEIELIRQYRADGVLLVNYTSGGEGQSGASPSPEHRAKLSAALKGKKWTPLQRQASENSTSFGRALLSVEHMKRLADARREGFKNGSLKVWNTGKHLSDEHREKISLALKGRPVKGHSGPMSDETKKKISDANSGAKRKPLSDEHKAKLSAAASGKVMSSETREKMAQAKRSMSEATKMKMSEAQKARWATNTQIQI